MQPDTVTIRSLRNDVAAVIRRVEAGEQLDVTRHGERVARIMPLVETVQPLTVADYRTMARDLVPDLTFLDELREMRADVVRDPYER